MNDNTSMIDLFLDNFKKIFYPEEWIAADLSFSKTELLAMFLIDRHGEIIMSQIASYVNVPMSTATGVIERLVKNGYIKRERSESDRRIVAIRLTDQGKAVVDELKKVIFKYVQLISDALDEEEKRLLLKVFLKVTEILEKGTKEETKESREKTGIKKIEIE